MRKQYALCPGSGRKAKKMLEEPRTYKDAWGFTNGFLGRAECPTCKKSVGLTQKGNLAHHAPAEQVA